MLGQLTSTEQRDFPELTKGMFQASWQCAQHINQEDAQNHGICYHQSVLGVMEPCFPSLNYCLSMKRGE